MAERPTVQLEENPLDQQVVTFDVGGTIYRVSRTLLDSHPNTMLARIASDTWNTGNGKAIFIERSGTRFECVLDYLRDGSVSVPLSVSKEALKTDLDYYGVPFEASHIRGSGSFGGLVTNTRSMARDHAWRAKEGELALEIVGLFVAHGSFHICILNGGTSSGQQLKLAPATYSNPLKGCRMSMIIFASSAWQSNRPNRIRISIPSWFSITNLKFHLWYTRFVQDQSYRPSAICSSICFHPAT